MRDGESHSTQQLTLSHIQHCNASECLWTNANIVMLYEQISGVGLNFFKVTRAALVFLCGKAPPGKHFSCRAGATPF